MNRTIKFYFPKVLLLIGMLIVLGLKASASEASGSKEGVHESIPILMYHSVGYVKDNELVITPEKFRSEIKYLKDNKYKILTMDELYNIFKYNYPIPEKPVVLTFDDGYSDNYKYAYPILKEYGAKATIFVITSTIDKDSYYLSSSQIKELYTNGIDIQSHTVGHEDLSSLSYEKQLKTLKMSKVNLEKLLNKEIKYLAYPFGKYNENTIKASEEAGYTMAFVTGGRLAKRSNGIYKIQRRHMKASDSMNAFISKIRS